MSSRTHVIFQNMKPSPPRILSLPLVSSLLVFSFFLAACDPESPPEPQPQPPMRTVCPTSEQDAFQGTWLEKIPENVFYFAGYKLELNFCRDSIGLRLHHWTDEIACEAKKGVTQCESNTWIDVYRGTWTVQDSILRIECRQSFAGRHPGIDTTRREVAYRITSGPGETMGLAHQGREEDFLAERMNILMQREQNLPE